ncbi:hypothetical protein [Micromonospora sp. DT41]|uniref:hypothetical protein n=1 Tax=Micromonospora sp. DT41 TaxID=3393437 RepID=UPI003CF6510A
MIRLDGTHNVDPAHLEEIRAHWAERLFGVLVREGITSREAASAIQEESRRAAEDAS